MKLWAQIDPVVGAPLTPNKQTNKPDDRAGSQRLCAAAPTPLLPPGGVWPARVALSLDSGDVCTAGWLERAHNLIPGRTDSQVFRMLR